jgi:signal transduction histidine kinase/ActR/RegA family two-component response regulator
MDAESDAIPETTPRAGAGDYPEAGLRRCLRLAAQLLGASQAVAVLAEAGDPRCFSITVARPSSGNMGPLAVSLEESSRFGRLHSQVLATGEPAAIPDLTAGAEARDALFAALGAQSALGVVLRGTGSALLGTLWVLDAQPRPWQQPELARLCEVGETLVTEVELRRELERLEELRRDLRAMGSARWLIWHADVWDDGGPLLQWRQHLLDEEAAQRFLPLDLGDQGTYLDAWVHSREAEDRPAMAELGEACVRAGQSYSQEFRCRDREGNLRWLQEEVEVQPETAGKWRVVGICTDVTERKLAKVRTTAFQSLGQQLNLAATPREVAEIIMAVADQLLGWDACWLDLCDFDIRQSQSVLLMDQVDGVRREVPASDNAVTEDSMAWRAAHEGAFRILRTEEELQQLQARLVAFGDLSRPSASLLCAPIRYGGRAFGALSIQSYSLDAYKEADLETLQSLADYCTGALQRTMAEAERRELQTQLLQSQKMEAVGRLAGGVAHDFNNMLAVINGYAELLLMRWGPNSPDRGPTEEILRAGQRAAALTRQLLAFSRKQITAPQVLDLAEAVLQTQKMLRRLIGEDIELVTLPEPDTGRVLADPAQLDQLLVNLAMNARDAMPSGGKLTIRVSRAELARTHVGYPDAVPAGRYALLEISDTGCGMHLDTINHVFEPFFTTKPVGQGSGLGLATVHGTLKQNGGFIQVQSELGNGTSFRIYLPALPDEARPERSAPGPASHQGTETILLVEDEEMLRGLLKNVLEARGYTVLQAAHGEEAIRVCERRGSEIRLLLTDVVMPVKSGRELADWVRAHHPHIRLLYMSGYTEDAVLRHGVEADGAHFIQKPFATDALAQKVRQVLDAPATVE